MVLTSQQLDEMTTYLNGVSGIMAALLDGSQLRQEASFKSDVDVALLVDGALSRHERAELQLKIIAQIERIVGADLGADVKILNDDHSLNYLANVINTGKLLVLHDETAYYGFMEHIALQYPDYYFMLQNYTQSMMERIRKGNYANR